MVKEEEEEDGRRQRRRPRFGLKAADFEEDNDVFVGIRPESQAAIRDTFAVQCARGVLKRPVVHVSFTYPRNARECCTECGDTDFLFVLVGLCNIFVLQFAVVVLLFFVDKEVDLGSLDAYYYPGGGY